MKLATLKSLLVLTGALSPLFLPVVANASSENTLAQATTNTSPTTAIPCPEAVPPGEVEGETITCGLLTVPENYDAPDGRQIELTYAVLHSHSLAPAPDPVMDLRGGPGGSVLEAKSLETRRNLYESLRQTRDIILLDQRGTQYSNRLGCAPTFFTITEAFEPAVGEEEFGNLAQGLIERFRPIFPEVPDGLVLQYTYYGVCAELLEQNGSDLSHYNTPNSARDVVNLTAALGYDDINLYGISYGTYLAQQIMRDHPDRIRSTILDSTVPMHVNKYEIVPRDSEVVFLNLIEDCEADAACAAAYPDLKQRAIALLNDLSSNPIALSSPVTHPHPSKTDRIDSVTPDGFAGLIDLLNHEPGSVSRYLPLMVHELEQGVTTTFVGLAAGDLLDPDAPTPIPGTSEAYLLEAEDLRVEAEDLLRAEAELAQTQRPASQWVERVRRQIATLPEDEQVVETANFYGVGYQSGMPRDRNTLLAYVAEKYEGEVAQSLAAEVDALSEVEVRHVYEILSALTDDVMPGLDLQVTQGMFRSLDCRENVPFSDRAVTEAVFNDLEIPQLATGKYSAAIVAYDVCKIWPVEPAPASEHTVLKRDIPTLVLQGRYDTQTNTEMGIRATEGLSNGLYVEFSSTGHGVIVYSDCAKDIGVAFVNAPDQEPDTSCIADLFPDFVLPPE